MSKSMQRSASQYASQQNLLERSASGMTVITMVNNRGENNASMVSNTLGERRQSVDLNNSSVMGQTVGRGALDEPINLALKNGSGGGGGDGHGLRGPLDQTLDPDASPLFDSRESGKVCRICLDEEEDI